MARLLSGDDAVVVFHDPRVFEFLGCWLRLACCNPGEGAREVLGKAEEIHPEVAAFLAAAGFESAWSLLQRHGHNGSVSPTAFHVWFDGLKTFRLVRHLSQTIFAPGEPVPMVKPLLKRADGSSGTTVSELNHRVFAFWGAERPKGVVGAEQLV